MPWHAVGSEAAARRRRERLRRPTGGLAALPGERADARARWAASALRRLRAEPLPVAAGQHASRAADVSGRRTRAAARRQARAVEHRAVGAVSGLDLAAPAARGHRV